MNDLWLAAQTWAGSFPGTIVWQSALSQSTLWQSALWKSTLWKSTLSQSTLWLTIGLLGGRVLRRHAARAHLALVLATVAAVLSPVLTATVRQMEWGVLPARQAAPVEIPLLTESPPSPPVIEEPQLPGDQTMPGPAEHVASDAIPQTFEPAVAMAVESVSAPPAPSLIARVSQHLRATIAVCWIIASFVLALRLVISLRGGRRIPREASDETSPELLAALREAAGALRLRSALVLRTSPFTRCPMIWCWGSHPAILLPESAAEQSSVNWRSIFCHELAHLVRRDHWSAVWAEVLVIALPWQPLAWVARRRLAFLREQACDDWVLAAVGEATDYAESLLQLVPQRSPAYTLAAVSSRQSLKRRLEHVLDGVRIAPNVGRHWIMVAGLLALLGIAGVALAQQRSQAPPKTDASKTVKPQPAAEQSQQNASTGEINLLPSKEEHGDVYTVRGRVLTPDGRPAAGARISIVRFYFNAQSKRPPVAQGHAGSQGEFELSYRKSEILEGVARPEQWRETCVVAEAAGFGLQWAEWKEIEPSNSFTLRLVTDVPIHGRVVDLQGQPVAGVRVNSEEIDESTGGTLDAWLEAVKQGATPWVAWPRLGRMLPPRDEPSAPPAITDRDGRFAMTGVGGERVARLELRSDTIAYKALTIATRAMSPIMQENLESETDRSQVFGKDFTYEAFPTQPIVGTVRDATTGQPLVGVAIESWHFAGTKIGGFRTLHTESDARGRYRLVGMPKGSGNKILVVPNDDQPHFMRELEVPASAGSDAVTFAIDLHRGPWITGRVTDRVTGEPVLAYLHYLPFRTNPYSARIPEFDPTHSVGGDQHRYRTRLDGSFRMPGMPGRAIVGAQAILASYRRGFGAEEIKGKNEHGSFDTIPNPAPASTYWLDALKEINPSETQQTVSCDLTLDPGESVQLRVVDPEGKPVSGCVLQGRRPNGWDSHAPSTFDVFSLAPGDKRPLVIQHEQRGLGRFLVVKFNNETSRTMTVQLEPYATLAGRVVDQDGAALKGVTLQAQSVFGGDVGPSLPPIVCRPDGQFEYKGIPTGCRYRLQASARSFRSTITDEVTVEAGKTANLGEIKLKIERGSSEADASKLPNAKGAKGGAVTVSNLVAPSQDRAKARRFSGRVVQPDGTPAAGAQVLFARLGAADAVELKATTGKDGAFQFSVAGDALFGVLAQRIVVLKPGFGPAWIDPDELKRSADLTLTLAVDDLPIEGRVLNLEGRPVVGATIGVIGIETFANDDLQPYVKLLKTDEMRSSNYTSLSWFRPWNPGAQAPTLPSARTDERGMFRLTGVGRHRRVELTISGKAIADTQIQVLTDPFEGMLNAAAMSDLTCPVYGARFVHHVRPSRPIVGTVTNAQTGRPIEGARVSRFPGFSRAITDATGRFELGGCEKTDTCRLVATLPQARSSYFMGSVTARDQPGLGPLAVQLHVYPAIPLTGRVTDSVTGKPVPAQVQYWPLYPNPHIVKGMCGTAVRATGAFSQSFTKSDGSFSVGVLPGPGALVLSMPGKSDFEPARVDAEAFFRKERVRYGNVDMTGQLKFDFLAIAVGKSSMTAMPQSQFQGIALLNVSESANQVSQNIDVRSKAKSAGK